MDVNAEANNEHNKAPPRLRAHALESSLLLLLLVVVTAVVVEDEEEDEGALAMT
jgi:hypothetical protein